MEEVTHPPEEIMLIAGSCGLMTSIVRAHGVVGLIASFVSAVAFKK